MRNISAIENIYTKLNRRYLKNVWHKRSVLGNVYVSKEFDIITMGAFIVFFPHIMARKV